MVRIAATFNKLGKGVQSLTAMFDRLCEGVKSLPQAYRALVIKDVQAAALSCMGNQGEDAQRMQRSVDKMITYLHRYPNDTDAVNDMLHAATLLAKHSAENTQNYLRYLVSNDFARHARTQAEEFLVKQVGRQWIETVMGHEKWSFDEFKVQLNRTLETDAMAIKCLAPRLCLDAVRKYKDIMPLADAKAVLELGLQSKPTLEEHLAIRDEARCMRIFLDPDTTKGQMRSTSLVGWALEI